MMVVFSMQVVVVFCENVNIPGARGCLSQKTQFCTFPLFNWSFSGFIYKNENKTCSSYLEGSLQEKKK